MPVTKETKISHHKTTHDGRGTLYYYICPHCGYKKNSPFNTVFNWDTRFETCCRCGQDFKLINTDEETRRKK